MLQESGYSGIVKTENTKIHTMERYPRLLLRRTSKYITAIMKNNEKKGMRCSLGMKSSS